MRHFPAIAALALGVVLTPAIVSFASAEPVTHRATGIVFPEQIADFKLRNVQNYETRQPGLGFAYHYGTTSGVVGSIFVYTAGLMHVPASVEHPSMGRLREQTLAEIAQAASSRNETARHVAKDTLVVKTDVGDIPVFFDAFVIESLSGNRQAFLWLWSSRQHVLKVRVTATTTALDLGELKAFYEPVVRLAARPSDWKRQPTIITMGRFTSEAERTAWLVYGVALLDWFHKNHVVQSAPDGPITPSFDAELHARQGQVRLWRDVNEKKPGSLSLPYMDSMLSVESAGFLREYIWHYHRRPDWKAEPQGLQMDAFQKWQAEHLRGHTAQTGAMVAFEWRADKPR